MTAHHFWLGRGIEVQKPNGSMAVVGEMLPDPGYGEQGDELLETSRVFYGCWGWPDDTSETPDHSTEAVQRRVDAVVDDLVAGRTTPVQRRGLTSATERAGRVSGGTDGALNRAIGGKP